MAFGQVAQAVATWHRLCVADVLEDAALAVGAAGAAQVPEDMLKDAVDYLCGRLSLSDPEPHLLPASGPR